jgi:hypothetical protein
MEGFIAGVFLATWVLWMYQAVYKSLRRQYMELRWKEFAYDKNKTRMAFDLIDAHLICAIPGAVPIPQKMGYLKLFRTDVYFDHEDWAVGLYIVDRAPDGTVVLYLLPKEFYPHDRLKKDDDLRQATLEMIRSAMMAGHIPKIKGKPYKNTEDLHEDL